MTDKEIMDLYESEWLKYLALAAGAHSALLAKRINMVKEALERKEIWYDDIIAVRSRLGHHKFVFDSLDSSRYPEGMVTIYGRWFLKNGKASTIVREIRTVSEEDVANGIPYITKLVA